jgi:tol-pal system protein YbgF
MRTRTQGVVLVASSLTWLSGCASASPAAKGGEGLNAEQRALDARQLEQARRISELEARIAMLEADARQVRATAAPVLRSAETIRIGATRAAPAEEPAAQLVAALDEPQTPGLGRKVPSIRLYGHPAASAANRESLAPLPVVTESLPVVPLPEQRAKNRSQSHGDHGDREDPMADYRAALRLLQERRFDQALTAFSAFVAANPNHALVYKALYWRGEARYAKREYTEALSEFEALLARFPESDKAPDALLKVAMCFRHLGAEDKAQASFRRLRAIYPNSQAASIASREGST